MSQIVILLPLGLAAAAGAHLGGRAPLDCHWSSLSAIALKTRLSMLKQIAPGKRRARLGALGLSGLLCAAAYAAYAAEPSAPERLAAQAVGVVGSGDQLALRLVADSKERTLKPGDDYTDGWKLDALTPTSAILVKDGDRREVGLNPTGALASATPATPPSQVQVTLSDDQALQKAISSGLWDGKTPRPGLTPAETRRYSVLFERGQEIAGAYAIDANRRSVAAGLGGLNERIFLERLYPAALGPTEGAEFIALMKEERANKLEMGAALYDRYGPLEVTAPRTLAGLKQLNADYPGGAWTFSGTGIAVLSPPDPQAPTRIPDTVTSLDQALDVRGGSSDWMSAAQWFAQAPGAQKP